MCFAKHLHASKFEADYCNRLLSMLQAKEIHSYRVQVPYELYAGIKHIVDFVVTYPDGRIEIHETKGFFTQASRIKVKLFKDKYPDLAYKLITKRRKAWKIRKKNRSKAQKIPAVFR